MFELIIGIGVVYLLFGNTIKGMFGEFRFKKKIEWWLNDYHRLISNAYFKTSFGTTQVDHILITEKGIIVIEVKNYANVEVFGTDRAKIWSVKYPNGKVFKPKNPLHQNYGHIKAIEKVLGFSDNIISLVVFSNKVKFVKKMPFNVINEKDFRKFYEKLDDKTLTRDEIEKHYKTVDTNRDSSQFIAIKHNLLQRFR